MTLPTDGALVPAAPARPGVAFQACHTMISILTQLLAAGSEVLLNCLVWRSTPSITARSHHFDEAAGLAVQSSAR